MPNQINEILKEFERLFPIKHVDVEDGLFSCPKLEGWFGRTSVSEMPRYKRPCECGEDAKQEKIKDFLTSKLTEYGKAEREAGREEAYFNVQFISCDDCKKLTSGYCGDPSKHQDRTFFSFTLEQVDKSSYKRGRAEMKKEAADALTNNFVRMMDLFGGKLPFVIFGGAAMESEKVSIYKKATEDNIKVILNLPPFAGETITT